MSQEGKEWGRETTENSGEENDGERSGEENDGELSGARGRREDGNGSRCSEKRGM